MRPQSLCRQWTGANEQKNQIMSQLFSNLLSVIVGVIIGAYLKDRLSADRDTSRRKRTFRDQIRSIRADIGRVADEKLDGSVYGSYQSSIPIVSDAIARVETDLLPAMRDRLTKACADYCALQDQCRPRGITHEHDKPAIRLKRKRFLELLQEMIDSAK